MNKVAEEGTLTTGREEIGGHKIDKTAPADTNTGLTTPPQIFPGSRLSIAEPPVKRKPGRPRKIVPTESVLEAENVVQFKKKRGRKSLSGLPKIKSLVAKLATKIKIQERRAKRILEKTGAMRTDLEFLLEELDRYEAGIDPAQIDGKLKFQTPDVGDSQKKDDGLNPVDDQHNKEPLEDVLKRAEAYAQTHPPAESALPPAKKLIGGPDSNTIAVTLAANVKGDGPKSEESITLPSESDPRLAAGTGKIDGTPIGTDRRQTLPMVIEQTPLTKPEDAVIAKKDDSKNLNGIPKGCLAETKAETIVTPKKADDVTAAPPERTGFPDTVRSGGEKDKDQNRRPKEAPRIPIAWANPNENKNPGPEPVKTDPDGKPPEPSVTILSEIAWTKIALIGPHPEKTTEEIANMFRENLFGCTLAFVDPLKIDDRTGGMILLRGGQWPADSLAAILGDLKADIQSFTSMTALEAVITSQRIIRRLQWVITDREKKLRRPR